MSWLRVSARRVVQYNAAPLVSVLAVMLMLMSPSVAAQTLGDVLRILVPPGASQAPPPVHNRGGHYPSAPPPATRAPGPYYPPVQRQPSVRPSPSAHLTRAEVQSTQRMLNDLGYDAGTVDGIAGRRTIDALNAFRRNNGLMTSSSMDRQSLSLLTSIHSGASARGELVGSPSSGGAPVYAGGPSGQSPTSGINHPQFVSGSGGIGTAPAGSAAARPSFDCTQARSPTEQALCSDVALATLDSQLAALYAQTLDQGGSQAAASLKAEQRQWLAERDQCGGGRACLLNAYAQRIDTLSTTGGYPVSAGIQQQGMAGAGQSQSGSYPLAPSVAPVFDVAGAAAERLPGTDSISADAPLGVAGIVSDGGQSNTPLATARGPTDLRALASLPSWLQPIVFEYHDGLPLAKRDTTAHLFTLMGFAHQPPEAPNDCHILHRVLFTDEGLQDFMYKDSHTGCWAGRDEFQTVDSRRAFYERYLGPLRDLAPRAPFRMIFLTTNYLEKYDATQGGFQLRNGLSDGLAQGFQAGTGSYQMQVSTGMTWPDARLPADEARARAVLEQIRLQIEADPKRKSLAGQRPVRIVGVFDVLTIDFDAKRVDVGMVSLRMYDPALTHVLHEFTIPPRFDAFIRGDIPERLNVPSPVPLNSLFALSHYVAHESAAESSRDWQQLYDQILRRDKAFYAAIPSTALPADDPRLPVFPAGGHRYSDALRPKLEKWAAAYRAGLSDVLEWDYGNNEPSIQSTSEMSYLANPLHRHPFKMDDYQDILDAEGLLPEQVTLMRDGGPDTLFVAPNRLDLYGLTFPKTSYSASQLRVQALYKQGEIKTAKDAKGRTVLIIYVEPISLSLHHGEQQLAERSYEDIPHLDGSFIAGQAVTSALSPQSDVFDMSPAMVDMIVLKGLSQALPDPEAGRMVTRRWQFENSNEPVSGGLFFIKGMREPAPEEVADITPQFRQWVDTVVPAMPVTLRIATKAHPQTNNTVPWATLTCSGSHGRPWDRRYQIRRSPPEQKVFDALMVHERDAHQRLNWAQSSMVRNRELHMQEKEKGRSYHWPAENEQELAELTMAVALSSRIQRLGDICGLPADGSPPVFIEMKDRLPINHDGAVTASVLIEITGVRMAPRHPHYTHWLSSGLIEKHRLAPPSASMSAPAIILDARLKEATYFDENSTELGRVVPDADSTLEHMESAMEALLTAQAAEAAHIAEQAKLLDIVDIRLGMDMEEAEKIIHAHMDVGRVLEGRRLHDGSFDAGRLAPVTSGKMFISKDSTEFIGIYDEAPAVTGKVLVVWRRVYMPGGTVAQGDLDAGLRHKYGEPARHSDQVNGAGYLWRSGGNSNCLRYLEGARNHPISLNWRESGEQADVLLEGKPVVDSQLPLSLLHPDNESHKLALECGPVVAAQLTFKGTQQISWGHNKQGTWDIVEQYLTDVGEYVKAFNESLAASKEKLAESGLGEAPPIAGGLKF